MTPRRAARTRDKIRAIESARAALRKWKHDDLPLEKWIRRPENSVLELPAEIRSRLTAEIWQHVETDLKYEGYIHRQKDLVERTGRLEAHPIPDWIDYGEIRGIKSEARARLAEIRPATLGQAGRISGITPADLSLLAVWIERGRGAGGTV